LIYVSVAGRRPTDVSSHIVGVDPSVYQLENTKVAVRDRWTIPANWKIMWENGRECYHCALNHPEFSAVWDTGWRKDAGYSAVEVVNASDYSYAHVELKSHAESLTVTGQYECRRLLGNGDPPSGVHLFCWESNLAGFWASPDHAVCYAFRPQSPSETILELFVLVHKDAVEGEDYSPDDLFKLHRVTAEQDNEICEWVQRGVNSPAFVPGPYSVYESGNEEWLAGYRQAVGWLGDPIKAT
jgi:Rieske 2Fe-2S family protein